MPKLLEVKNLHVEFYTQEGVVCAVNGVDFGVERGETLGIVGESGCGKTVTALSVLQLIPSRAGKITEGEIWFNGENLLEKNEKEMCAIRGSKISMMFQDPMTSLNPAFTIGFQLTESIHLHQHSSKAKARQTAIEMLRLVGIPSPEQRFNEYPHQLSGGMCQRVMIAIALSSDADLLIADEPTTALDVTIQAQILELMQEIKKKLHTSIILITHDLGVVAGMCDRVAIMYAGKIVENGELHGIFEQPLHPYTRGLLDSIPRLDKETDKLHVIRGMVPSLTDMPKGCSFCPRCDYALPICAQQVPDMLQMDDRAVRCWLYAERKK
ncbi:MAG: ABC transporter ATP-binding protein [Bacteroidota bacterium]